VEKVAKKIIFTAGLTSMIVSGLIADAELITDVTKAVRTPKHKEYTQIDQPVCHFKAFGKPWMLINHPEVGELDMYIFGWYDQKANEVKQVKTSADLEFLRPIRLTAKFVDNNVQIDRIYEGWRESYVGQIFSGTLELLKILPKYKPEGNPFINAMLKEQIPSKIVMEDAEALSYFVKHLKKALSEEAIATTSIKPLLFVEFKKPKQVIKQEDLDFLTTYWEMIDPQDQEAKLFFKTTQRSIDVARADTANAKPILESYGEMFMRLVEKEAFDFKGKDLMANATAAFMLTATIYLATKIGKKLLEDYVQTPVQSRVSDGAQALGQLIRPQATTTS
jgi:hypothetical protein